MAKPPARGKCPECHYSFRLRKYGAMQSHRLWSGSVRCDEPCAGTGQLPVPFDPNDCATCLDYRFMTPGLTEACFSVAIESRKSGDELMRDYLVAYHSNGHQEP